MTSRTKRNLLGVLIDAVDYEDVVSRTMDAARDRRPFAVSALAVHGVMTGVFDIEHRFRLNNLDIVTPDGQPVRWGLNILHGARLAERVYGPTLMLRLCEAAASEGIPVYLYGSSARAIDRLRSSLPEQVRDLRIVGAEPSKFRQTTAAEKQDIVDRILASGARIVFVGLGCPRQEIFAHEYRDALSAPVVAVGAAFDYHAGLLREPPGYIQRSGLQWLYRLIEEPARLWRRYLILNPTYMGLLVAQGLGLWSPRPSNVRRPRHLQMVG